MPATIAMINISDEPVVILKEFKGEFCVIKLRSDGILQVNTFENVEYTSKEAASVVQSVLKITNNKQYNVLIVSGKYSTVTVESMELLSSPIAMNYAIAKAYVIDSIAQKILANFFLSVIKPKKPVRFFEHQKDAEMWLKSLT